MIRRVWARLAARRWLPQTLFGQLFAVLLAGILISHILLSLLVFSVFDQFRPAPVGPPEPPPLAGVPGPPPVMPGRPDAPPPDTLQPHERREPPARHPPRPGFPPIHHLGYWLGVLAQIGALALGAWFGARTLARPIQRLGEAATRLAENLESPPLPLEGTLEARQSADAFNRMQQRIRRQVAERNRFLAAVSHDLRTPLTRMQLRAERIADADLRIQLRHDMTEMAAMLDATLQTLRDDARREPPVRLNVTALVHSLVDDLQEQGKPASVSGEAGPVQAQPVALRRCLANLLENAIRYGGQARVLLGEAGDKVRIEIQDDGPGIPEALLEQVFEPFFRVESSRSRATGGVGLGLSIARETARQQGGDLVLRNRPEGGLSACLELPRAGAADTTESSQLA